MASNLTELRTVRKINNEITLPQALGKAGLDEVTSLLRKKICHEYLNLLF